MSGAGGLRDPGGRVRLGRGLLLFLVLFGVFAAGASWATPSGPVWDAAAQLAGALAAGWILLDIEGKAPGALGFGLRPRALAGLGGGLALGLGVAGASVALLAGTGSVVWWGEPGSLRGLLATGVGALGTFALPAAAEEALVRGYPLQALARAWGPAAALWATSLAFGLMHVGNPEASWLGIGNIVLAGLLLGGVYLRTGSLWWATGAHLGWNWALGFGADLPVSGLDLVDAPYFEATASGPTWLSGGSFGPEGSVLSASVLALAAVWVWSWKGPGRQEMEEESRPLWMPVEGEVNETNVGS